jgi:hypothetical protein
MDFTGEDLGESFEASRDRTMGEKRFCFKTVVSPVSEFVFSSILFSLGVASIALRLLSQRAFFLLGVLDTAARGEPIGRRRLLIATNGEFPKGCVIRRILTDGIGLRVVFVA